MPVRTVPAIGPWENLSEEERSTPYRLTQYERLQAHFEQRIANDQVRELRRTGACPTCGATEES